MSSDAEARIAFLRSSVDVLLDQVHKAQRHFQLVLHDLHYEFREGGVLAGDVAAGLEILSQLEDTLREIKYPPPSRDGAA